MAVVVIGGICCCSCCKGGGGMEALTLTGGGGTMFVLVIEVCTMPVEVARPGGGQFACNGPGISPGKQMDEI